MRARSFARIIGTGMTPVGKFNSRASHLMKSGLELALSDAKIRLEHVNGLIAIPSLAEPHFMEGNYLATQIGLLPRKDVIVRTIDTGGAGPISALLEAVELINAGWCSVVAVVAGDAISSLSRTEYLRRADATCCDPDGELKSPVIPNGYDRVAQWHMNAYGTTREQLAMCSVLMSHQASCHPLALTRRPHTLSAVLSAPLVDGGAKVTGALECARRADGGAAVIVASKEFVDSLERQESFSSSPSLSSVRRSRSVVVLGGGEASGPLYPPPVIDERMFSCEEAVKMAYEQAQLSVGDIDFFGLYDCFPICLIRAIEAVGLAPKGEGGKYIQARYEETMYNANARYNMKKIAEAEAAATAAATGAAVSSADEDSLGAVDVNRFPINTHGGLLGFAAPWEVPALYNVIEAVSQLRGECGGRQLGHARRALVYGNGGIFSHSAVAILGDGEYRTTRSRDKKIN